PVLQAEGEAGLAACVIPCFCTRFIQLPRLFPLSLRFGLGQFTTTEALRNVRSGCSQLRGHFNCSHDRCHRAHHFTPFSTVMRSNASAVSRFATCIVRGGLSPVQSGSDSTRIRCTTASAAPRL